MIIQIDADLMHIAKRTDGFDFSTLGPIDDCQREIEMGGEDYNRACPVLAIVPVMTLLVDNTLQGVYTLDTFEDIFGGCDDRDI